MFLNGLQFSFQGWYLVYVNRGSSFGITTDYRIELVLVRSTMFTRYCPNRLCGPPSIVSNDYRWVLCPGVNRQGLEADHSYNAEVKKTWIYTSTPPYAFMA
jgi:hypothetical protein